MLSDISFIFAALVYMAVTHMLMLYTTSASLVAAFLRLLSVTSQLICS